MQYAIFDIPTACLIARGKEVFAGSLERGLVSKIRQVPNPKEFTKVTAESPWL